jgi:hypothetical protein
LRDPCDRQDYLRGFDCPSNLFINILTIKGAIAGINTNAKKASIIASLNIEEFSQAESDVEQHITQKR